MRKVNGKQKVIEDERNEGNKRNGTELKGEEKVGNGKGKGKEVRESKEGGWMEKKRKGKGMRKGK